MRSWENRALYAEVANRAQERVEIVRAKISSSMDVLHSVDSLFATRASVSPGFCGVRFRCPGPPTGVVRARLDATGSRGRARQFEGAARADGLPQFQFVELDAQGHIVRAADRAEYFPIYYLEPAGTNFRALGFDLTSSLPRRQAMDEAARSGQAVATPPMRLVQAGGGNHQRGFVVYLPLLDSASSATSTGERPLRGFASAVFWVDDLLGRCVAGTAEQGLAVRITDPTSAAEQPIYEQSARAKRVPTWPPPPRWMWRGSAGRSRSAPPTVSSPPDRSATPTCSWRRRC